LNKVLNYRHQDLFQSTAPELCVRGGKNAGKTYSIADKLLLQTRIQPDKKLKAIVVRKTLPRIKSTVLEVLEKRAEVQRLPFNLNKSDYVAQALGLKIQFLSMENKEDHEKARSVTDVDFVWINEITELREIDYDMLRMIIRGGQSSFHQLIFDFNPIGKTSWVYKRFFENGNGRTQKLHYTVYDNPWAKEEEIELLREYKESDENLYNICYLGEWGELEGVIYNWDTDTPLPEKVDEVFYGGDFGYSVDPAALIRIYRKADEFWVEEVIYETGLTNIELGNLMIDKMVKDEVSYWDSAEPKSIQELYDMGINAKPCEKGPDSVRAGIDFLKQQKMHIIEGSENISREQRSYIWKKDKDGNSLNVPIDFNNHCLIAGTLIMTKRGQVPIDSVDITDIVLTRSGWKRVLYSGLTSESDLVKTVYFSNGSTITGTADHRIWIKNRGFVSLDSLRFGDIIEVWQNNAFYIREFHTDEIQAPSLIPIDHTIGRAGIRSLALAICIEKFGKILTEKFRTAITFIIGTGIHRIIQSIISNLYHHLSIVLNKFSTVRVTLNIWPTSDLFLWHGIDLSRAENGIKNTVRKHIRSESRWMPRVTNAGQRLKQWAGVHQIASALTNVSLHGDVQAEKTTRCASAHDVANHLRSINTKKRASAHAYVLRVTAEPNPQPVFDLTIEGTPEFYANGILVHNSMDAIRYGIYTHCKKIDFGFGAI